MSHKHDKTPALEAHGLSIAFGSVQANQDISFSVQHGQIHALLGENGAGKSTLVKMLYGVYHPDAGSISIDGTPTPINSPAEARRLGIGLVFQDMRLIPALKVWQNVALFLSDTPMIFSSQELITRIREASQQWGLSVDPLATVSDLSIGEWQRVELLKVLIQGARILILDEPTSVLTPDEVTALFAVVRKLRDAGTAVIIITHKMREVREIADRVTILRKGRIAFSNLDIATVSDEELVTAMVGHTVEHERRKSYADYNARPVLELAKVSKKRADGTDGLKDVSLRIWPGEVLGVAGISGHGQEELADILSGFISPDEGDIVLADKGEYGGQRGGFASKGVTAVPADPIRQMVIPGFSIARHAALWEHATGECRTYDEKMAGKRLETHAKEIGLSIPDTRREMATLSGGNIQRVILTMAIASAQRCIVASYPTRGLDVGTTMDTRQALLGVRARGCAVVLISEDIDEILEMSDRVMVLADGRIQGVLNASDATRSSIGKLMTEGTTVDDDRREE